MKTFANVCRAAGAGLVLAGALAAAPALAADCPQVPRQPITQVLIDMVAADSALKADLQASIAAGQVVNNDSKTNPVASLDDYYDFIDALVTYNPQNIIAGPMRSDGLHVSMNGANYCDWNILDILSYSYFLVDRQLTTDPRGQIQFANSPFSEWLGGAAEAMGAYLETPDSARYIPDFTHDPTFGDWYCPPAGGYKTFQDFFVRELCPKTFPSGSRPVAGLADPRTVVAIGDSTPAGWWPISQTGQLVTAYDNVAQDAMPIKGQVFNSIADFIKGRPGETLLASFGSIDPSIFNGGTFTHQFLNVNNYHRLHVPVAGKLVYMAHFKAGTRMKSGWVSAAGGGIGTGYYDPMDTPDWQFGQTRLVLGIETETYGTVVAVPMGMAQVSAIRLRDWVKEGAKTEKGWEFANFAFGGSDFVLLFEPDAKFTLTAEKEEPPVPPGTGVNYQLILQGAKFGCLGGGTDCSAAESTPSPYPGYGD